MVAKHSGLRPDSDIPASPASRRHSLLSFAVAVALGVPGVGYAQQTPPNDPVSKTAEAEPELEEIVVTGIRAGIQQAIQVKSELGSIAETISAEDIGKLPDTSIADAISRMPGLTTQRAAGRANFISIRGTDPALSTGLMNGREQVSTGDTRTIEYDQYPAELINSVIVYKTPDSQIVGQGLAGTVDLRTIRPLDFGREAIVLNLRGVQNSQSNLGADQDDNGYRASFSYVGQFMDDKLGIAFGYARLDDPIATKGFGSYEPWKTQAQTQSDNARPPNWNPGMPADAYITEGFKVRTDMGSTVRDGYLGTVEFRPTESYGSILDFYYSAMDQEMNARSLEVNVGPWQAAWGSGDTFPPGSIFNYSNPVIKGDTVVSAELNNVAPMARNFLFLTDDSVLATGWLNEFQLTDQWKLLADISYSKATRNQRQWETNAAIPGTDGNQFTYTNGFVDMHSGKWSKLSFDNSADLYDPTTMMLGPTPYGSGWSKKATIDDELTSFRLDAIREAEAWWFSTIGFGVNYGDRTKDKTGKEGGINTIGGGWVMVDNPLKPTNLGYAGAGKALAWNVKGALRDYYQPITYLTADTTPWLIGKNWSVEEEQWTGYLRATLDHVLSDSVTLKGNIGVQAVYTDQSSTALKVSNPYTAQQQIDKYTAGTDYTDWLPQFNLIFELPDQQAIRLAIAEEMARPKMDDMKASVDFGWGANGIPGGSGGNPFLDPWRAWAYDLSYEKYFSEYKGYVSAAVFYKDLTSYIYTQTVQDWDYSYLLPPDCVVCQSTGSFTTPVNGQGGMLWGLEFAVSLPFETFSQSLEGFGFTFSYAYTDSDIEIEGSINSAQSDNIPLPGLSDDVWNATLYYERYGFGARIATRYRSDYIGQVTNFANEQALRYVKGGAITDLQVSYSMPEGTFEGLQFLFQINNLTNEPYEAYVEDKVRVLDYQEYGTQYLLGVNYSF